MRFLQGFERAVYSLAFLPGGRLAAGGADGAVGVWDVLTGEQRVVARDGDWVEWLAASPDGAWLAWCGGAPHVTVAPVLEGGRSFRLPTNGFRASACAFAPDGLTLCAVASTPACWRVGDWSLVLEENAWRGRADSGCLAFAPDGATVATATAWGMGGWAVCFWDTRTGVSRPAFPADHPFDGRPAYTNLAYSPDGRLLAGLCSDELRVWVAATAEVVHQSWCEAGPLHGLAFSPDGRVLATGGNDGFVTLREAVTWRVSARYDWKLANVQDVAFNADGMLLAAAGSQGKVVVWDVDD